MKYAYPTSTLGKFLAVASLGFLVGSFSCAVLGLVGVPLANIWGTPALVGALGLTAAISLSAAFASLLVALPNNPNNLNDHGLSNRQMNAAGGTGLVLSLALAIGTGIWSYGPQKEKAATRAAEDAAPRAPLLIECRASAAEAKGLTQAFAEQKSGHLSSEATAQDIIPRDGCRVVTAAAPR